MKQIIFSGIQPTGTAPHIGNYLGALKQWVEMQKEYSAYYFIPDLHAITIPQDPIILRESIYTTYALLLSIGLDPDTSTIFIQSQNPYHTELMWILNCFTHKGELNRMTQYKEKSEKYKDEVTVGLYDYPVLMASDILLYDTDIVPVGEDQVQHIELTRDIASRFNNRYGETFVLPKPKLVGEAARVMSLQNPEKKMSKSDDNQNGTLFLLDSKEMISKKIKSAVTDSERDIVFDRERKGLYNLLTMYKVLSSQQEEEIEKHFEGKGYGELKTELAELVIQFVAPIQDKYTRYTSDRTELEKLMKQGAEKATTVAAKKVREVKEKLGFIL